jgi:c-di-AMP phosphodiesterase-like protein
VGHIARQIGGGGHSHSAATVIVKKNGESTDDIIHEIIGKMEKILVTMKK